MCLKFYLTGRGLVEQLPGATFCSINPKSGGKCGPQLLTLLHTQLGKLQVRLRRSDCCEWSLKTNADDTRMLSTKATRKCVL